MYKTQRLRFLLLPCLFLIFACFPASRQTVNATLSGTVLDQNGAIITGVSISVQNDATSLVRTSTTNESGTFTIPLLQPGTYTVTARANGFTRAQFPGIVLNVNDERSLRIELKVGSVDAAIEVRP